MVGSVCQTIDIDKEECKIRRWKNAVADFELHDREEVCSLQLTQGIDAICVFRSYKGYFLYVEFQFLFAEITGQVVFVSIYQRDGYYNFFVNVQNFP